MRLSESKVNKIAIEIVKGIKTSGAARIKDETGVLKIIREEINKFLERDRVLDAEVREKLSHQKNVTEGSDEWRVLYKKYYEESRKKRGW